MTVMRDWQGQLDREFDEFEACDREAVRGSEDDEYLVENTALAAASPGQEEWEEILILASDPTLKLS